MVMEPSMSTPESSLVPAPTSDVATRSVAVDPLAWLSGEERNAYDVFLSRLRSAGSPTFPLSPETEVGLYQLFLNGRGVTEIYQANPNYNLGQIVYAAISGNWAARKVDYLNKLYDGVTARFAQASAEGIELAADVVAAARLLHSKKIAAYLKSSDEKDLAGIDVTSLAAVTKAVDLMLKLSGQDRVQKHDVRAKVEHEVVSKDISEPGSRQKLPPVDRLALLTGWAGQEDTKKQRGRVIDVE